MTTSVLEKVIIVNLSELDFSILEALERHVRH